MGEEGLHRQSGGVGRYVLRNQASEERVWFRSKDGRGRAELTQFRRPLKA